MVPLADPVGPAYKGAVDRPSDTRVMIISQTMCQQFLKKSQKLNVLHVMDPSANLACFSFQAQIRLLYIPTAETK